ncbi:MAG: aminomethyl-transferring glycine dehydrogenase subunit GcvPA [Thermovirgaceae bacterium]
MSRYTPATAEDRRRMLEYLGVGDLDDLYSGIPEKVRQKNLPDIPKALSEPEVLRNLRELAGANGNIDDLACFLGAGAYDHFIPAAVDSIISLGEFTTCYTPYQPEVSQGTLQAIFQYQTMVCELTGMEVSNASMYDGASAVAEAAVLAASATKKKKILWGQNVNPQTRDVLRTYCWSRSLEQGELPAAGGTVDQEALDAALSAGDVAALVVQSPSFFGTIEDLETLAEKLHQAEALLILSTDLLALGTLEAPGKLGADIVAGDGQTVGNPISFGGPAFGFIAVNKPLLRRMPGRICGQTVDSQGRRAFVLTLQAREQHIRREKATSNICSNQNLCIVAASVYFSLMGPQGLREVGEQIVAKTEYAVSRLEKSGKFRRAFPGVPHFREVALLSERPVAELNSRLLDAGIIGGYPLEPLYPGLKKGWLLAVTENRTKEEIDRLVAVAGGDAR